MTYVLRHGIADRHSLRASSYGIGGILDVGAGDNGAAGQEQSAADVEVGVWAFLFDVLVAMGVLQSRMCLDYAMPAFASKRATYSKLLTLRQRMLRRAFRLRWSRGRR